MSRSFNGTDHQLRVAPTTMSVDDVPLSLAIWANIDSLAPGVADRTALSTNYDTGNDDFFSLAFGDANNTVRFQPRDASNHYAASGSSDITASDTWFHYGASSESGSSIAYLGGVAGTANADAISLTNQTTRFTIGSLWRGGEANGNQFFPGKLVWAAIWNIVLATGEWQMLADGKHPYRVRMEHLKFFAPCWGDDNHEAINGYTLTEVGTGAIGLGAGDTGGQAPAGLMHSYPRGRNPRNRFRG